MLDNRDYVIHYTDIVQFHSIIKYNRMNIYYCYKLIQKV
ncbi:hypothetical protein XCR1_1100013 [Xenorhabdus cabanillasii JM26]|uniref:Uncharacterized protein n=1 Tax=Xenorhabdus cabanillasii JM26 TaxID=1427517 RepID=W1ILK5_9GAMM|nr:hypothetical protein XCR1_1100013 [Xenorhabdus cabanillasii JM26]